jgi:uncharacterized protein YoxC
MLVISFIMAIIAIIISLLAYRRAGGARELKKTVDSLTSTMESLKDRAGGGLKEQVEHLTSLTESLKEKATDAIDRVEKAVSGKSEEKAAEEKVAEQKPSKPKRPRPKRK